MSEVWELHGSARVTLTENDVGRKHFSFQISIISSHLNQCLARNADNMVRAHSLKMLGTSNSSPTPFSLYI